MVNPLANSSAMPVQNYDLTDALQFFIEGKEPVPMYELGSTKKVFTKGDVIVSRLRSYLKEIALVATHEKSYCVGSSEFIVLRALSDEVSPEVLLVYLRSTPVQQILKWCQSGSNHPRFMEEDLLSIKIPDKVIDAQKQIQEIIYSAINVHQQAKRLLNLAKRAVEIAIEEDEVTALSFG